MKLPQESEFCEEDLVSDRESAFRALMKPPGKACKRTGRPAPSRRHVRSAEPPHGSTVARQNRTLSSPEQAHGSSPEAHPKPAILFDTEESQPQA